MDTPASLLPGILEPQKHRTSSVGGGLKADPVPTLCCGQDLKGELCGVSSTDNIHFPVQDRGWGSSEEQHGLSGARQVFAPLSHQRER